MEARILYLFICFVTYIIVSLFYPNMEMTTFNYDVKPDFNAGLSISKGLDPSKGFTAWYRLL